MKRILVVVDMQNDFISGSLKTQEAAAIVPKVAAKIKAYKSQGDQVVYTRDTHTEAYLKTAEGRKLPVVHCVKGTWGWEIESSIRETMDEADEVFDKPSFGCPRLGERLREKAALDQALEVELIGLCTDICVISNALLIKAFVPEAAISVDGSCCAGVTPLSHENALKAMQMCQIEVR